MGLLVALVLLIQTAAPAGAVALPRVSVQVPVGWTAQATANGVTTLRPTDAPDAATMLVIPLPDCDAGDPTAVRALALATDRDASAIQSFGGRGVDTGDGHHATSLRLAVPDDGRSQLAAFHVRHTNGRGAAIVVLIADTRDAVESRAAALTLVATSARLIGVDAVAPTPPTTSPASSVSPVPSAAQTTGGKP
jgi:hypothetical protein